MNAIVQNILPFFPMSADEEYAGILAAVSAAADAEIARLDEFWAARAAESERAYAEAVARADETRRKRREYDEAVIFLVYPQQLVKLRDRRGRVYVYPRYVNLGPRYNASWREEEEKYVDRAPLPKGAVYRTAAQLGLDNGHAARHFEDRQYYEENRFDEYWAVKEAYNNILADELIFARTLACFQRRHAVLAAFAAFNA
jgi:hypothetical protein